jgi:hypothetical protein
LVERLGVDIYSFPMKYIPLHGEEAKDRAYIGKKWNKKFIRAIQCILNVTKGIVAPGRDFFEVAFGKNINEFYHLLYMPEAYIVYRKVFSEKYKMAQIWRDQFDDLMNGPEAELVKQIIVKNDFRNYQELTQNPKILSLMQHYTIGRKELKDTDAAHNELKRRFSRLIKENQHLNLTLTYDFEATRARSKHKASARAVKDMRLTEVSEDYQVSVAKIKIGIPN